MLNKLKDKHKGLIKYIIISLIMFFSGKSIDKVLGIANVMKSPSVIETVIRDTVVVTPPRIISKPDKVQQISIDNDTIIGKIFDLEYSLVDTNVYKFYLTKEFPSDSLFPGATVDVLTSFKLNNCKIESVDSLSLISLKLNPYIKETVKINRYPTWQKIGFITTGIIVGCIIANQI